MSDKATQFWVDKSGFVRPINKLAVIPKETTMKKAIKIFSFSIFLVCILPMFQTCADSTILKLQLHHEVIADSTVSKEVLKQMNDSLKRKNKPEKDLRLAELRKEYTANAYELGFSTYKEFELKYFRDWTFYPSLCFTISIIISLIILVTALKENVKQVFKLSILNFSLLVCSMLIFVLKVGIEIIDQIRYGYYILILNVLTLIVLSKIQINRNNR